MIQFAGFIYYLYDKMMGPALTMANFCAEVTTSTDGTKSGK